MKRKLGTVGKLLVVASIGLHLFFATQNRLTVENVSGQTIRTITISVGGENFTIDNLKSGASASRTFSIRSDDHFAVRGELADRTRIDSDWGYVTNGMSGVRALFKIGAKGDVVFDQNL
ncbi:MAG: hypothetical protein V4719_04940 [Planctomycetota bacterium]